VRPHLVVDGGNVEVVDITDEHVVIIKWLGNCESCFMSAMTMKAGIEETLKNKIPEVTGVEAINGVEI
jgi:Fe-S cluster biogenesis protein NfuA